MTAIATQKTLAMEFDEPSEEFTLDGETDTTEAFQLEMLQPEPEVPELDQFEFFLPEYDPEHPEDTGQLEFDTMPKPIHWVSVQDQEQPLRFQHAKTLLESLEAQSVHVPYQCREGYCGSCRTELVEGEVAYLQEPMAWINEGEILPCCCVPKSDISLKIKG